MTHEDLNSFDSSPTIARFKIEKLMKDNGIKGSRDGKTSKGKQKFTSIKLEPSHREKYVVGRMPFRGNKYIKVMNSSERGG